jgi:hypothetical protein
LATVKKLAFAGSLATPARVGAGPESGTHPGMKIAVKISVSRANLSPSMSNF